MINLLMFLSSSIAVAVGVAFAVGLAWIAVLIPVLIFAAAGYGLEPAQDPSIRHPFRKLAPDSSVSL
jgi:hypothetical protein